MIDARFSPPDGFSWAYFTDKASGARIRYGHVAPQGPATEVIVMAGGFGEPGEKYFETIRERVAQGAAVWYLDWRGQGGSDRYLPSEPMKSHHAGYDGPIATLDQFAHEVVRKQSGADSAPLVLMAHSMGAHIGLRFLAEHAGVFDRAVFTDPMMRFGTGALPEPLARAFAAAAVRVGCAGKYVPGGGPWTPLRDVFPGNQKTSDPVRFRVQPDLFSDPANDNLRTGSPTFGWVWHSFRSCDILNGADYLKSINTPVLMQVSGDNDLVVRSAVLRAASLIPGCKLVDIPAAKHEIWMERDGLRDLWLAEVASFLASRPPPHTAPKTVERRRI